MYWQLYPFTFIPMITKGLASLAIAATLVASSGIVAFAKDHDKNNGFPGKGIEMRAKHHAEIDIRKSPIAFPKLTSCTFTALDKRDMAHVAAQEAFHAGMKASLSTRKASITAALALTDETARIDALKKAQEAFKTSTKKLKDTLKSTDRSAQEAFKTEHKACAPATPPVATPAQS